MDYLMMNAKEIMFLLIGISVFVLMLHLIGPLRKMNYMMGKVKGWVDFFDENLQKPFAVMKKSVQFFDRFL